MTPDKIVSLRDIEAAAERIAGVAVRTPLIRSDILDDAVGASVFVKVESLQRTGSFKFRGAYNRIAMIPETKRADGVVACSSGNHAQGLAEAARLFGIPATIVMPHDAPALKRERTQRSGAAVVGYDRAHEDRDAIANAIAARTGATFVHPFDDPGVMAGQGTAGLEIAADLAAMGRTADRVLVPTSGGGLIAGVATAMAAAMPGVVVQPVEPEGFDDLSRSLDGGARVSNPSSTGSIADALLAPTPGANTFEVHKALVKPGVSVPDDRLRPAMAFAARELKLVAEPGGVIALAALLSGRVSAVGETVVVLLSGGNVDDAMLASALAP